MAPDSCDEAFDFLNEMVPGEFLQVPAHQSPIPPINRDVAPEVSVPTLFEGSLRGHDALNSTIPSPGQSTTLIEFSPSGRFLAIGDQSFSSLFILDKFAGYHPTISAAMLAEPTALVWETSKTFYVGLSDGCFVHYRLDLGNRKLVKGPVNRFFHGVFPVTAIALDSECRTLVLSVGPEVFAFRRTHATGEFHFAANISSRFNFKRDPGIPGPPFPRSICFTPNNTLVIAFSRQNIASVVLEFDRNLWLCSSFQTVEVGYTGFPLLKAITSADKDGVHWFSRFWIHSSPSPMDDETFPFLFIDEGAATLSGSATGAAIVRDTVTQRQIQRLEHTVADRRISMMVRRVSVLLEGENELTIALSAKAYHVSSGTYNIATVDCREIKIWIALRPSPPRSWLGYGLLPRKMWIAVALVITLISTTLSKIERLPNIEEISQYCFRTALILAKLCIEAGYLALRAADAAVLDAGEALD